MTSNLAIRREGFTLEDLNAELDNKIEIYEFEGRWNSRIHSMGKAFGVVTGLMGIGSTLPVMAGTFPLWGLGAVAYAGFVGLDAAATGKFKPIPWVSSSLGDLMASVAFAQKKRNGEIEPDAVLDQKDSELEYESIMEYKRKVAYLLCSEWRPVLIPYLMLRDNKFDAAKEYNRVVTIVAGIQGLKQFVKDLDLIEISRHGNHGVGTGAFMHWLKDEIDRKYAARVVNPIQPLDQQQTNRMNRQQIEIQVEDDTAPTTAIKTEVVRESQFTYVEPELTEPKREVVTPKQLFAEEPDVAASQQFVNGDDYHDLTTSLAEFLQSLVVIGRSGSGKGFVIAHAIAKAKKLNPELDVWYVDPKADQSEDYVKAHVPSSQIFNLPLPDPMDDDEDKQSWLEQLRWFIKRFKKADSSKDRPKLLVFDEIFACQQSLGLEFNKKIGPQLVSICILGRSKGVKVWAMSQNPNCASWGLDAEGMGNFRRIALVNNLFDDEDAKDDLFNASAKVLQGCGKVPKAYRVTSGRYCFDSHKGLGWAPLANLGSIPKGVSQVIPEASQPKAVEDEPTPPEPEDEFDPVVDEIVTKILTKFDEDYEPGYSLFTSDLKRRLKLECTKQQYKQALLFSSEDDMIQLEGNKITKV